MISKTKIDFLFYCPDILKSPFLGSSDSLHCVKVLRKKEGDFIFVTNGQGSLFTCAIEVANTKACKLNIVEQMDSQLPSRQVHIAICPTKNSDRIEYFIEKSVEIGVSSIYFVFSTNTYPKKMNMERMNKIAVSAMKQSLKTFLPVLHEPIKFEKFISSTLNNGTKYIAHLDQQSVALVSQNMSEDMLLLIGPEGDFTIEEILKAEHNGFKKVSMGTSRLRTETAGIVAVSLLNLLP
jgi:16S rRNA (uracil1498-N3)-methyltransferase